MRTYEDMYPNQPRHFQEWWEKQLNSGVKAEHLDIARAAWNHALSLAEQYVCDMEGTAFGVENIYKAITPEDSTALPPVPGAPPLVELSVPNAKSDG
jgi:hypothetical protein